MGRFRRLAATRGFTILELFGVCALVAITATLVFSAMSVAKAKAKEAPCISNLRQLGAAMEMYRADSDGAYPLMLKNLVAASPQILPALRCPADDGPGANKQDTDRVGSKVSVYYWGPYPDGYRDAITAADTNHGIAYCVLHGRKLPNSGEADARLDTTGRVLRLLADSSVHIANVGFHCGKTPEGVTIEFRSEWSLLTDAPCTNGLLCDAAPDPCKDSRE